MKAYNPIEHLDEYAPSAAQKAPPTQLHYIDGWKINWKMPAKWWNWFMSKMTTNVNKSALAIEDMRNELAECIDAAASSSPQLLSGLNKQIHGDDIIKTADFTVDDMISRYIVTSPYITVTLPDPSTMSPGYKGAYVFNTSNGRIFVGDYIIHPDAMAYCIVVNGLWKVYPAWEHNPRAQVFVPLIAEYDPTELSEYPDDPAGVTYIADWSSTTDGWYENVGTTVTAEDNKLKCVFDGGTATGASWGKYVAYSAKNVRLRVVSDNDIVTFRCNDGTTTVTVTPTAIISAKEWIIDLYVASCTRLFFYINNGLAVANTVYVNFIYIGTGAYLPGALRDITGNGYDLNVYSAVPVGEELYFNGVNAYLRTEDQVEMPDLFSISGKWVVSSSASMQGLYYIDDRIYIARAENSRVLRIAYAISGNSTKNIFITDFFPASDTEAVYIELGFDFPNEKIYVYKNGLKVGEYDVTGIIKPSISYWYVGRIGASYYNFGTLSKLKMYAGIHYPAEVWDNFKRQYGTMLGTYSPKALKEYPDDPAGTTYLSDFSTMDGWVAYLSTLSIVNEELCITPNTSSGSRIFYREGNPDGKTFVIKLRYDANISSIRMYNGTDYIPLLSASDMFHIGDYLYGTFVNNLDYTARIYFTILMSIVSADPIYLSMMYIGTGAYLPGSLRDITGNGYDLNVYSAVPVGEELYFNGENAYLQTRDQVEMPDLFSISCKVDCDNLVGVSAQVLFVLNNLAIFRDQSGFGNRLTIAYRNGATYIYKSTTDDYFPTSGPVWLELSIDYINKIIYIYKNGLFVTQVAVPDIVKPSSSYWYVGRWGSANYLSGTLSLLCLWNVIHSPQEVWDNYQHPGFNIMSKSLNIPFIRGSSGRASIEEPRHELDIATKKTKADTYRQLTIKESGILPINKMVTVYHEYLALLDELKLPTIGIKEGNYILLNALVACEISTQVLMDIIDIRTGTPIAITYPNVAEIDMGEKIVFQYTKHNWILSKEA